MNTRTTFFAFVFLFFALNQAAFAQITTPAASPSSTLTQKVGLTDVTVNYSRPSAKGRVIFGDIVPFDALWRTGANAATKIKFSTPVTIGDKKVEAGEYSLLSIPGKAKWTIILNKNVNAGTANYKQEEDAARLEVSPMTADATETFTINLANLTANTADLEIVWEKTKAAFKIVTDVDGAVTAQIDNFMKNPTSSLAGSYWASASYYLDNGKDMNKALEWANKSIEYNPSAFWVVRGKALIQAKLKDYKGAIETAKKSIEGAKAAKNDDYVRMNEKSIAEWEKMK
jgi:Protein of unknown function (DUF2911)